MVNKREDFLGVMIQIVDLYEKRKFMYERQGLAWPDENGDRLELEYCCRKVLSSRGIVVPDSEFYE